MTSIIIMVCGATASTASLVADDCSQAQPWRDAVSVHLPPRPSPSFFRYSIFRVSVVFTEFWTESDHARSSVDIYFSGR